ncbi:hypothetical protein PJK55_14465 [Exiguobacterium sp. MMG028]|nr:hypothetical protein [Exiguobacterium sp. MMG028]
MYKFALQMWQQRRVDEAYLMYQVEMGRLTQAEVEAILASPQNPIVE